MEGGEGEFLAANDTVYAKRKEISEATKQDILEANERELGDFKAENIFQSVFILLDEPESGLSAKLFSLVLMAVIFASCVGFMAESHPSIRCEGYPKPSNPPTCKIDLTGSDCRCSLDGSKHLEAYPTHADGTRDCPTPGDHWIVCDTEEESTRAANTLDALHVFEAACIIMFTVEFLLRMVTCTHRPRQDRRFLPYLLKPLNIVDIFAILPWYVETIFFPGQNSGLAVLRILRLSRIFRVMKAGGVLSELQLFVEGYKRAREGLLLLFFLLFLYLCVFAALLFLLEYDYQTEYCFSQSNNAFEKSAERCFQDLPDGIPGKVVVSHILGTSDHRTTASGCSDCVDTTMNQDEWDQLGKACDDVGCSVRGFTSIPTTWYFIMATMTTVGYGDHVPKTTSGMVVCGACMLVGIMVLALPIIVIGNAFEEVFVEEKKHKAEKEQKKELKKLEREMNSDNPSKETQAKIKVIKARTAAKITPRVDVDTCVHTTTELLTRLSEETGDLRFGKALTEILKDV